MGLKVEIAEMEELLSFYLSVGETELAAGVEKTLGILAGLEAAEKTAAVKVGKEWI
jgi:hypothetical protein